MSVSEVIRLEVTTEQVCESLTHHLEVVGEEVFEKNFHRKSDGTIIASVFCVVGPMAEELTGHVREWLNQNMKRKQ